MLSLLLLAAFLSRQLWGWLSDRIGGLWTILMGGLAQTLGMLGFLATQERSRQSPTHKRPQQRTGPPRARWEGEG